MLTLLLLLACGPDEDVNDSGIDSGVDTAAASPSHAADIQPIWDARCGGCHLDGNGAGYLNLDDGYASLVGVDSFGVAGLALVAPGDPNASYLWHKLQGTHAEVGGDGLRMPKARAALPAEELASIEAWIIAGAAP